MTKTDRFFSVISIGPIIFLCCFCIGWWLSYASGLDFKAGVVIGALAGIILDIIILPKTTAGFYKLSPVFLTVIYTLYMIGIFGMFMGVPVFNIIPGILAALYMARKMKTANAERSDFETAIKKVYLFSAFGLFTVCVASAVIALHDPYTAENIEGMLGLGFDLGVAGILGIIIIGGASLIIIQYYIEKLAVDLCYGHSRIEI